MTQPLPESMKAWIETEADKYIQSLPEEIWMSGCINDRKEAFIDCLTIFMKAFTDKEMGEVVTKIAYKQTAEEQADDFVNKVWILKEFIESKIKGMIAEETEEPAENEHLNDHPDYLKSQDALYNRTHLKGLPDERDKEIERLEGLVEKAFDYGLANKFSRYPELVWTAFKEVNNFWPETIYNHGQ